MKCIKKEEGQGRGRKEAGGGRRGTTPQRRESESQRWSGGNSSRGRCGTRRLIQIARKVIRRTDWGCGRRWMVSSWVLDWGPCARGWPTASTITIRPVPGWKEATGYERKYWQCVINIGLGGLRLVSSFIWEGACPLRKPNMATGRDDGRQTRERAKGQGVSKGRRRRQYLVLTLGGRRCASNDSLV